MLNLLLHEAEWKIVGRIDLELLLLFFFFLRTKATFEFSCILNKASVRALSLDLIIVP